MNAVLWVAMITAGWLALSVAAVLLLVTVTQLRRWLAQPLSPPASHAPVSPRPALRVVPSLPQQRSAVESSDVLRVVR